MGGRIVVGGGIGAGKSTVLALLSEAGFFVIESDRIGHDVLANDAEVARAIADRWPSVVVNGELSRPAIAAIVFADSSELRALEAITHPAISSAIDSVVDNLGDAASVAVEVPVMGLLGPGWVRVAVIAPVERRVERAVARGSDPDDVRARVRHQPTDDDWIAWADHVVDNGADREATEAAVARIIEETAT